MSIKNPKPMHPGKVLTIIYLSEMGINQTQLAKMIGCSHRKVNEIVNEKRGISAAFALDLERVLKTSAEMWVRMQAEYDLYLVRKKAA